MQISLVSLIISQLIVIIQGSTRITQGSEPSTGDTQAYTCGDTNNKAQSYLKGDNIYFCVQYVNSTTSTTRMAYKLIVDSYTAVQAFNAYSSLGNSVMTSIAAQAGAYNPTPLVPYIVNSTLIYPIFNVIVYMTQGTITGIVWNNVCFTTATCGSFLDSQQVQQENEYINPQTQCSSSSQTCDPKVYVAYTGTDANGEQLTSASYSMPRYRQFSSASVFNNALDQFKASAQSVTNSANNLVN